MPKKLTKEIVNERIEGRGITLIGEYKSNKTKTTFSCPEGHTWDAAPSDVMKGGGCPHCNRESKKLTKETINARIANRGITLIGEYENTNTKTAFQCPEGHTWDALPNDVMGGTGCPHCAGLVPLTKEIVNERIADRGIVLIGEYENTKTKTAFQCSEGHTWNTMPTHIMSGIGCPHCAGNIPLTKEIINERIADRGIVLVGECKNATTKTAFKCPEGHEWSAVPSDVMAGKGCPHCAGNITLTKDIVNERIADRGIKLIGEYKSSRTKTTFQCKDGHTWDAVPKDIMNGSGCPHCAGNITLTKDIVNQRIADRGIKLIGDYKNSATKTAFQCAEGHTWETKPNSILNGIGCPHCSGKAPLTKEIVNERIADRGITLIGEYKDTKNKATFQCPEGHTWDTMPDSVMRGTGCPHCDRIFSDNDTIYIWKAKDCHHHGKQVYKIGITSARLGDERIKHVARKQGIEAEIITLTYVRGQATDIERRLHNLGEDPKYAGHGGTEFRALSESELKLALEIISEAEVEQDQ